MARLAVRKSCSSQAVSQALPECVGLLGALAPGFQVGTKKQRGQGTFPKVQLTAGRYNPGTWAPQKGEMSAMAMSGARARVLGNDSQQGQEWGASQSALHKYLTSVLVHTLPVNRKKRGSGQGSDGEPGSSSFCQLATGTCPQLTLILP